MRRDFIKKAAASALAVGMLGASILGSGLNVLMAQAEFVPPRLNFTTQTPSYVLDKEYAAHIGARHIWDVFGESVDGMYVTMSFSNWEENARMHWRGTISSSPMTTFLPRADEAGNIIMFNFALDAITGEALDISRHEVNFANSFSDDADSIDRWAAITPEMMDAANYKIYNNLTLEQREFYEQKAKELVQRFLPNFEIADVAMGAAWFGGEGWNGVGVGTQFNDADEPAFYLASLTFSITDGATGRVAHVAVSTTTNAQFSASISTSHNDIVLPEGFATERAIVVR